MLMTHINKSMARQCMPRYSTTKKSSSDNVKTKK